MSYPQAPSTGAFVNGPHLGCSTVCESILRSLPDWFGIESAIVQYVKDVEVMPTFLACAPGGNHTSLDNVAGFLTVNRHFDKTAEVHLIAVRQEWHKKGIGSLLLYHVERWLEEQGVQFLQVKTLSPARECEHYARTRAFYLARGFLPLEEFKTLWGERNPCLQLIKRLTV